MNGMDFFGHQEGARAASRRLLWLFTAAVATIVLLLYFVAWTACQAANNGELRVFEPALFGIVAAGTLAVIGVAMAWKTALLRSGGGKVAQMLGGREVPPDTQDPKERMLRNLVEEMAIASGTPVPEIYVLDGETGINAFAAGWSPADAAVAVTRGCLDQLTRDELQGVIAHEFSHVFHGDMRLNIRLIGVLFGIVCIATLGRILVRVVGSGRGDKKGGVVAIVLIGIGMIVIGYLGVFFARLIQSAVSRQREYLADASAVQYTRNPRGIGMALAKIGGLNGRLQSPHAEEASHMMFADGVRRFLGGAFATHPPVERRVERILPGFLRLAASSGSLVEAAARTPLPPQFAGLVAAAAPGAAAATPAASATTRRVATSQITAAIGAPEERHVTAAKNLLANLPLDLATAAHTPFQAKALVAAALLDRDPARRQQQLDGLGRDGAEVGFVHEVRSSFQAIARMSRDARLPLVELAVPALRRLPEAERATLGPTLRRLALADGELSPFEFALLRTVERCVRSAGELPQRPGRPHALVTHSAEAAVVLSVLAHTGAHGDEARAARAFARGKQALAIPTELALLPRARCSVRELEPAVEALAAVSPLGKRNLVAACAEAAADDGVLDADETDLLRALTTLWDVPVPLPDTTPA
ncbi:MAG: M48 family metallopeptidase [Planctomycetes bacterium]|nr:M48 family metallopeptidase [Planctomycetota bacterium]